MKTIHVIVVAVGVVAMWTMTAQADELADVWNKDLAGASHGEIQRAADEDAIAFCKSHPDYKDDSVNYIDTESVGRGRAFKRGLLGDDALYYAMEFRDGVEAIKKAEAAH